MTISNKSHFSTLSIITLAYKYFVSDPIGMGSFVGHAYPGSLFMVLALWWTVQMLQRYFRCKRFGTEYVASVAHKSQALPRVPIEPIFKMAVCTFGIVGEIIQGHYNEEFAPKNWHHATMFVFFGFSGLVDMLVHYGFRFPKNVDYSLLILSIGVEGFLFFWHVHGREPVDVFLHKLLVFAIFMAFCATFAEMRLPYSITASLARPFFFFLKGTWFWQIGFTLYGPFPVAAGDDHVQMMIAVYFTWHVAIITLFMFGLGILISSLQSQKGGYTRVALSNSCNEEKIGLMEKEIPSENNNAEVL